MQAYRPYGQAEPLHLSPRAQKLLRKALLLLFVLLFHVLVFWLVRYLPWTGLATPAPPKVEVQSIDPAKLDAIRKHWKQVEKGLILNKDPNQVKSKEKPKDAKYISDRNRIVDKETRARDTDVLPKPGSTAATESENRPSEKTPHTRQKNRVKNLGALGVPFHIGEKPISEAKAQAAQNPARSQRGADQSIRDRNLPIGNENLLNTEESIYYAFYSRLYEAIGPIWQSRIREVPYTRRVQLGEYTTQVDVVFDREGNLIAIHYIKSSGVPEFDQAVEKSWRKISRFPNPPKGLLNEQGQVHTGWNFTVQVGQGFNLDSMPPERTY